MKSLFGKSRLAAALFTALLAASCEKDVDLKVPEQPPLLTLHGVCTTGDTVVVAIGQSRSILNPQSSADTLITDATVVLTEDGTAADTLRYDPNRRRYVSKTMVKPGRRYRISAARAGRPSIVAETTAPEAAPIVGLEYNEVARTAPDGQPQDEIRLRFTDPPTAGDFYLVDILGYRLDYSSYNGQGPFNPDSLPIVFTSLQVCAQTADASYQTLDGTDPGSLGLAGGCVNLASSFLRDERFNGTEKEFRFYFGSGQVFYYGNGTGSTPPPDTLALLTLTHLGSDYLRYLQSREAFYSAEGNPFAEPVNVRGNVQGGYGIFVIGAVSAVELEQ